MKIKYLICVLALLWTFPCIAEDLVSKTIPEKITVRVESPEKFGRLLQEMERTDEKGVKNKRVITWIYYKTGEVALITIKRYSDGKMVSTREIKHYLDGKQPTAKVVKPAIVVEKESVLVK